MKMSLDEIWKQFEALKIEEKKMKKEIEKNNVKYSCDCEEIDYTNISEVDGSLVCTGCGLVFEARIISQEKDWSNYADDNGCGGADMERCGAVADPLIPSYYSYTEIRGDNKMNLFNKYISIEYKDRAMYNLKLKVSSILAENGISNNLTQRSMLLYKKFIENKDTKTDYRGKNKIGMLAACVYYTAKNEGIVISSKKISKSFDIEEATFAKSCKILNESYNSMDEFNEIAENTTSVLVETYARKNNLNFKLSSLCKKITIAIEKLSIFRNVYSSALITAVIIFVNEETGLGIPKKSIVDSCGSCETSYLKYIKAIKINKEKIFTYIKINKL